MRLRLLHEALFGRNKLSFVGYDQKPVYLNTSSASKTFSIRGSKKVAVKECVAASRERFTVMTHCQSWPSAQPPPLAILFKAQSAVRIRTKLQAPANTLLQFAEKGSYRLAHVLAFLQWPLPWFSDSQPAAAAEPAVAVEAEQKRPALADPASPVL